jgi:tRNA modification GTPase
VTAESRTFAVDDTIVAIATATGSAAIGMIRVSGSRAVEAVSSMVRLRSQESLSATRPRVVHAVVVVDPKNGTELDEAVVVKMLAPRSYTGEDMVELSCHGNPALLAKIVQLLLGRGARLASPGEFTRRAYLNGRMDLVQAEAVAELIGARSERAARLASRQLRGALSSQIAMIRQQLLDLVAELEVVLDFPEDEIGISPGDGRKRMSDLAAGIERLTAGARQGRAAQDGLVVVLAGTPNVGKSSLFNSLLDQDRVIVSPIPGTTRDLVDGALVVQGVLVRLMDGAGLGDANDAVDAEGMRRSRRAVAESDLVLVVLDGSRPLSRSDRDVLALTSGRERMLVVNKSDLPARVEAEVLTDACRCSALTGAGLAELRRLIEEWVERRTGSDSEEGGLTASLRVLEELNYAGKSLRRATDGIPGVPLEATLVDLRAALHVLGAILGVEAEDELLDRIFSRFCVGK